MSPGRGAVATAGLLAWLVVACAPTSQPQQPTSSGRLLTLALGQTAPVPGEGLQLKFEQVVSDSRCPSDVACIQAGEAVVAVTVIGADRTRQRYEVHTSGATSVVHAGLTISLERLEPRPVSARPIRPADYRLTLRVGR